MDVVLLHDEWLLPVDLYQPLQEAGHRVVSHGADVEKLGEFLAAMRWKPQAFVVDARGRVELAETTLRWLRTTDPWRTLPVVVAHPPGEKDDRDRILAAAGTATMAETSADALAALP